MMKFSFENATTAKAFRISPSDTNYFALLFDREKDPGEMRNVLSDPAYAAVGSNLIAEVTRLRAELKEPEHDDPKAYGNQPKKSR